MIGGWLKIQQEDMAQETILVTVYFQNFILFFYILYLLFIKKYDEVLLIISSLIIFWFIIIHLIGLDEFKAFLNHTKTIVSSIDLIHGKKYPVPFFLSVKSNMAREPQEDFCYNLQLVY